LIRINNKAKVRRSTKSVILGKAKVISYKDIEEVQAKRAAKEVIKGKGNRSRKRKSTTLEAGKPEPVGYRRFQLLYLPRNTGLFIYSADQSRPYK